jgi:hypothetical protein
MLHTPLPSKTNRKCSPSTQERAPNPTSSPDSATKLSVAVDYICCHIVDTVTTTKHTISHSTEKTENISNCSYPYGLEMILASLT